MLHPALAAIVAGFCQAIRRRRWAGLLRLDVRIQAPDLRPCLGGNALPGVWSFTAEAPGPHVAVVALTHGNEIGGALMLDRWLGPGCGRCAGGCRWSSANLDAYARFDPEDPTASRFIDEDFNRVWDEETLAAAGGPGTAPGAGCCGRSSIPSMSCSTCIPCSGRRMPLMLVGPYGAGGAAWRCGFGLPPLVVADDGHLSRAAG